MLIEDSYSGMIESNALSHSLYGPANPFLSSLQGLHRLQMLPSFDQPCFTLTLSFVVPCTYMLLQSYTLLSMFNKLRNPSRQRVMNLLDGRGFDINYLFVSSLLFQVEQCVCHWQGKQGLRVPPTWQGHQALHCRRARPQACAKSKLRLGNWNKKMRLPIYYLYPFWFCRQVHM